MPGKKVIPLEIFDTTRTLESQRDIRKAAEDKLSIGDHNFVFTAQLEDNIEAKNKFLEITEMYKKYNYKFVTTADTQTILEFCLTWSEYLQLQKTRDELKGCVSMFEEWMKIEGRIDTKNGVLTKLAGLLYLTPGSRLKVHDVPDMKKPNEEREKEDAMFG